jgi:hypothetical protein
MPNGYYANCSRQSQQRKEEPDRPSPFPGMNPYLENDDTWENFHGRLITIAAEKLEPLVGANYKVKIETRWQHLARVR